MISVLFPLLFSQTAFAAPIRVAVESSSSSSATSAELAAQLNDDTWYDFDATVVAASDIDSATELASYDVVILGDSGYNQVDWTSAMASALATWTNAGNGGVLSVGWVDWVTAPGSTVLTTIDTVQPIDSYSFHYAWGNNSNVAVSSISHPVTDGLAGTTIAGNANHVEASASSCDATNCQVLGTLSGGSVNNSGTNAIVVGEYGGGRIVFLGQLYMAASGYNNTSLRSGDADRLLEQAVAWIADAIFIDTDGDGIEDSADNCPSVSNPSQADTDGDGVGDACDECDGDDAYGDIDGDLECADIDCDDTDASVNTSATEICDYIDNNCDGTIDEDSATGVLTWYADSDSDGYGSATVTDIDCWQPTGYVSDGTDCDDANASVNPAATEICDYIDNNCDGSIDEDSATGVLTWYADSDSDGYGSATVTDIDCWQPPGYVSDGTDCDDSVSTINPGATEFCNGVDDNCNGSIDEDSAADVSTWYADSDTDGYGDAAVTDIDCAQPSGFVADNTDCDDSVSTINPGATEYCNGVDDNCDGDIDEDSADDATTWYADSDSDGYGDPAVTDVECAQPSGFVADDTDCDDTVATTNPGASEYCNGVDDDCDLDVDEDSSVDVVTWYADADADGYGNAAVSDIDCDQPSGMVDDDTDCDDTDPTIYPGAEEIEYDGIDQDCDSADLCDVDEDTYTAVECGGDDCDDSDDAVHVDAVETWYDGVDQDCDERSDYDADYDGYDSESWGGEDCDDAAADVYPGAPDEYYDGVIHDCDEADEFDADGDGYDAADYGGEDCDDANSEVRPDASETWYDGVDDDCDGNDDDQDFDGYTVEDDCDDTDPTSFPGAEGLDDDCNAVEASLDGLGADSGLSGNGLDGATGGGGLGCSGSKAAVALGFLSLLAPLMRRRRRED